MDVHNEIHHNILNDISRLLQKKKKVKQKNTQVIKGNIITGQNCKGCLSMNLSNLNINYQLK